MAQTIIFIKAVIIVFLMFAEYMQYITKYRKTEMIKLKIIPYNGKL